VYFLAISGSLRAASTNTAALEALARLAPADVEIALYRSLAALPHFNPDDDEETPPPAVVSLRALVGASAGLIVAMPEYAHGVTGVLKNALDWLVASDVFQYRAASVSRPIGAARDARDHVGASHSGGFPRFAVDRPGNRCRRHPRQQGLCRGVARVSR
jgi:NAD(P)H-dependent FMN reductase